MTYATPLIPANWSISACTVEASRVRMRSTPDEARLFAMAVPLDVNSSVIRWRSVWTEMNQVTAASGTSTAARNRMILARRPKRGVWLFMRRPPSGLHGRRPVRDRNPALTVDAREVHAVESLVTLGSEAERRTDAEVEVLERLQRLPETGPGRMWARPAHRLDHDPRVHVALQADEAVALGHVLVVAERGRDRRVVALHQGAVLDHAGQGHVVVARHHLRVDERAGVVPAVALAVLDEEPQHRVGAHEGHVGDRHRPAEVAGGAHEGPAALVGARAQHGV